MARVKRAKAKKDQAVEEYREAVVAARALGLSLGQIAEAAGVTKQAVDQVLVRRR